MTHPRCIAIGGDRRRCHRRAALRRMGNVYVCTRHSLFHVAIIDDSLSPATRRRLAHARWKTLAEVQALVNEVTR